ncbi:unnamed protein product [Spirodela intermedia]|uniref:SPX domain-containing protein n=1 Tax=Spirodela intermedia TaxID=51605 RepID=A0A7I8JHD8_SPIIN|nr:unnamed protein product [Spirodela intermedia]CAA6668832.1 unnamed protein product [Spirodela intermedia]
MKFGKEFRIHLEETLPEWRDKFLCYKPSRSSSSPSRPRSSSAPRARRPRGRRRRQPVGASAGRTGLSRPPAAVEEWFVGILNDELDKFNDFYVDKEEEFVIRLQELKERIEGVGAQISESSLSEEMLEIRKAFVRIHGEMVLLKNYSSLNFMDTEKVRQEDGRAATAALHPAALRQPFFSTEPLTRLVRECEANLELLFPLEPEVLDSGAAAPLRHPPLPRRRGRRRRPLATPSTAPSTSTAAHWPP